jgi:hypothetical protein
MHPKLPFSFTAGKKIIRYQLAEKRDTVTLMNMRGLRPQMEKHHIRVFFYGMPQTAQHHPLNFKE